MSRKNKPTYSRSIKAVKIGGEKESCPEYLLAAEIVVKAIEDWRSLVKSKAWLDDPPDPRKNFGELRSFFKSEWCDLLMVAFDITPAAILDKLEKELAEAMKKERDKKWTQKNSLLRSKDVLPKT